MSTDTTPSRRKKRNDRRVLAIDAFIDLGLEHGVAPRPAEVADRAGVSIASLYRYFATLEELHRAAIERLDERFPDLFGIPAIGTGGRHDRIERYTASRVALHEKLHALQRLPRAMPPSQADAVHLVDTARRTMADQIRLHFDDELSRLSPTERDDLVSTIAVLTSVESWEQFRRTDGHDAARTRATWAATIDRLLPPSRG